MQLKPSTLNVLKNFSQINSNLVIDKGNKIRTISPSNVLFAEFSGDDTFSEDVSIYNLNEFLAVVSVFDKPELTLDTNSMLISQGKQKVNYIYADKSLLVTAPKGIKFPSEDIKIQLSESMLSKIQKMSSIIGVNDMSIYGDKKTIVIKVFDKKNPSSNSFEIDTEVVTTDEFYANFKIDNLKVMSGTYDVVISKGKRARLTNLDMPLVYYIALEADSSF